MKSEDAEELYGGGLRKFLEANGWRSEEEALQVLRRGRGRAEKAVIEFLTWCRENDVAPSSIRSFLSGLRTWLELNDIRVNWAKIKPFIPKKTPVRDQRPITKRELRKILPYLRPAKRLCVWFMTVTGARLSEALGLKVRDLDLEADPPRARIKTAKSGGWRTVYIPSDLAQELRKWVKGKPEDYAVFPSEWDPKKPPDKKHIQDAFLNACKKAGIARRDRSGKGWELSPHSCRRAFETWLYNAGMQPTIVKRLMGHKTGLDDAYYKPSEADIIKEWKKFEHVLLLETEIPVELREYEERIVKLEEEVKRAREQAETLNVFGYWEGLRRSFRLLTGQDPDEYIYLRGRGKVKNVETEIKLLEEGLAEYGARMQKAVELGQAAFIQLQKLRKQIEQIISREKRRKTKK